MDIFKFEACYRLSFEYIFENNIPKMMNGNIDADVMKTFYNWNNPIFDQFSKPIEAKEKYMSEFSDKINPNSKFYDEKYATYIKNAVYQLIESLTLEERNKYICFFRDLNLIDKKDLISLGYYSSLSLSKVIKLKDSGEITQEDFERILYIDFAIERQKQEEKNGKKSNRILDIIRLMPKEHLIDMYFNGEITLKELSDSGITKNDLFNVSYETLISILTVAYDSQTENDRMFSDGEMFPKRLRISSKDIINQYGRTINGKVLYKLLSYGYIQDADLIDVVDKNRALEALSHVEESQEATLYDEDMIMDNDEVFAFYSPSKLINMQNTGSLDITFIDKYVRALDFENRPKVFRIKSQMLIDEMKKRIIVENPDLSQEQIDNLISEGTLRFFDIGLCDEVTASENIQEEFLKEQYLEERIDTKKILELYQSGIISEREIYEYYDQDTLFKMYLDGEVSLVTLSIFPDIEKLVDNIEQAFLEQNMPVEDIMILYFSLNVINLEQFREILEFAPEDVEISISAFVNEDTPVSKIKELFVNCVDSIDYSALLEFKEQGYISDEEFNDILKALDTKKFCDQVSMGRIFSVYTERKSQRSEKMIEEYQSTPHPKLEQERENQFKAEIELLSRVTGINFNDKCGWVESYNSSGRPTSLNNYQIYISEEYGIGILRKSKKENRLFMMNIAQLMYFLSGKEKDDRVFIENRMRDKAFLSSIPGVIAIEHTEYLGKNIVEAACRLSPVIEEQIKVQDGYVEDVEKMVTNMRNEYRQQKGLRSLDED